MTLTVLVDGRRCEAAEGQSLAALLCALNLPARRSVTGEPRLPWCGMGICGECRVAVDGRDGVLGTFTDVGSQLDNTNRVAAQKELASQALQPEPMKLAREATRRAVEQSFALPLKAAGLDATVRVRFAGEGRNDEIWDMSKQIDGVKYNQR